MKTIKNIEVFGDSILKGVQVNPEDLRYKIDNNIDIDAISKKHSLNIFNRSKFGCTIGMGIEMIERWLGRGGSCDTIVMDFGGNDCDFNWKEISERPNDEHQPKTPLAVFTDTYHRLIEMLKSRDILPILSTLPPISPQKFFDWFCGNLNKVNVLKWLGDINSIYRYQEKYSRAVEDIAREHNVPLVDLRGEFLKSRRLEHLLCIDGTHPNTEGQKTITKAFLDFADLFSAKWKLAIKG